jgi:hypothetical protein
MTAAIALEHGYTLVTRNRRDYEDTTGLTLYDPTRSIGHGIGACLRTTWSWL